MHYLYVISELEKRSKFHISGGSSLFFFLSFFGQMQADDDGDDAANAKKAEFIEKMDRFVTKSIINEEDPVSINVRKRLKTVFQIAVLLGDDYEKRAKDHLRKCGAEEIFRWAKDVCVDVVHMSSVLKSIYEPILKNMIQASS